MERPQRASKNEGEMESRRVRPSYARGLNTAGVYPQANPVF